VYLLSDSHLIPEYQDLIVKYIVDGIGQKKVRAIILTGSLARNQASFKKINGKVILASDIDLVIVVKSTALLKSLGVIKEMSSKITDRLCKFQFISQVSFSVITEESLAKAEPSMFMFDLIQNGRTIYSNVEGPLVFPHFSVKEIPKYDIYRLLFNRMVEALDSFVTDCMRNQFDEHSNVKVLKSLQKLYLSIIQSIYINEGTMILNSSDVIAASSKEVSVSDKNLQLCSSIETLRNIQMRKSNNVLTGDELEKLWIDTVQTFKEYVECNGFNVKYSADFDKMFPYEAITRRLLKASLIFLQYHKINSLRDLLRSIIFVTRFGSDHIYLRMYANFLSSVQFIKQSKIGNFDDNSLAFSQPAHKKFLRSFSSDMKIWRHKTGT
jgi:predicted nucleotidyltransferase